MTNCSFYLAEEVGSFARRAETLPGGLSTACDFVNLAQNGFCIRPVAPPQGLVWASSVHSVHCVSASHPLTKQILVPLETTGSLPGMEQLVGEGLLLSAETFPQ